jgi:hypothetical protein
MPKLSADGARLPSGGEFSPNQIDLGRALEIVSQYDGDRFGAEEALRVEYFASAAVDRKDPKERLEQQRKRAGNVLIGMATYGLQDSGRLTKLGHELLQSNEGERNRRFATHILKNRNGMTVLSALKNLQMRGDEPTKGSIAEELERLGLQVPRATTHHLVLLNWLRQAGVVRDKHGYDIDEALAAGFAGVSLMALDEWGALTNPQRAVLRVLRNLAVAHGDRAQPAQYVIELVELQYGRIFGARDQLRRQVFGPLENVGWVTMSQPSPGRGGKSGRIAATRKLLDLDIEGLPAAVASEIPADLRTKLNTPLEQIHTDLSSQDTYRKGIALELLAIRIATDLNITPRRFRLRGIKTAGAEVDLVAEAVHLHFSRWMFQCKNTASVDVTDLAKEVGMAVLLKAHVIVLITTGTIGSVVRRYARTLAQETSLQAVLVDGRIVRSYLQKGAPALFDYFHNSAAETLQIKRSQSEEAEEL